MIIRSKGDIQKFPVVIPPTQEQQRIVEILDHAFEGIDKAIENTEKNLKNARELFESELNRIFTQKGDGWETAPLAQCFKMKSGDNLTSKNMVKGPYSVYGGNGIAGKHHQYNLEGKNVIVGRVGALCGNVHYVDNSI